MEEDFSNSQQADREKLTQDIERLKLAVRDTSFKRRWNEYSDSEDEEALRISEAGDGDGRHNRVDAKCDERSGPSERYFAEEAIKGISQDSLGSTGSLELGNSPEICLALNREYQEWIKRNLLRIQIVLDHNRQCQLDIKQDLQNSSEKVALGSRRKTLTAYSKPYFKDGEGSFPPPNEDSMKKRNASELDPFVRPPKTWSATERNRLREAVQADRLQRALRPFMMRKEFEHDRLKNVVPDSEEEQEIKDKIADLNSKIRVVRESADVDLMYGDLTDVESIDWMKIANIDFEALRTPESCKLFWINAAHPNIAVSKWTAAEDAKLIELVSRFEGVHWKEIARCLNTNRSAFMCLQRYQTKLNPCLQTGKWTPEEDDFLKEVVNNYKRGDSIPWSTVAYYVEGRSREQCARRWEQMHPRSFRKGRWTAEEDDKLAEAARLFGVNKWWKIKEFVPGRTAAQCRERWKNTLDQTIHFGEWKYEEDKKLWLIVQELGAGHWQRIARDYLPGRTDNMCLQRYRRLLHWYKENKAREKVRRKWKSNRLWRRFTDKHFLRRRQLEQLVCRVKMEEAKEKATMSALQYIGEVGEENKETPEDNPIKTDSEIPEDEEMQSQPESVGQLDSCETEAIKEDIKQGIFIPRPSTRSFVNRNGPVVLNRFNLRNVIERRVKRQIWLEKTSPSKLRTRLEDLARGNGTTAFSRPLQEKLRSLSDNSTIQELVSVSNETQTLDSEMASSSVAKQCGRPKRSEEEADIEHKIAMLVSDEVTAAKDQRRKCLGENSHTAAAKTSDTNCEDLEAKSVRIMCRALNFRRCAGLVSPALRPASKTSDSASCSSSQESSASKKEVDCKSNLETSFSSDQSIVLLVKKTPKCSSLPAKRSKDANTTPDSLDLTPSDPRLSASLGQGACGRAVLHGAQSKIYTMPALPPSCGTLNGFKSLLLNRAKLLSVAGKFQIPGIVQVSSPEKDKQTVKAGDVKTEEDENGLHDDSNGLMSPGTPSLDDTLPGDRETEILRNSPESSGQNINGTAGNSKSSHLTRTRNQMKRRKQKGQLLKQCQVQIVKSNLRSRRVLAAIRASHDYHMFHSRFLSSFLWPAFLSAVPVKEVKRAPAAGGQDANDAPSSLSNEDHEQDSSADECSSDDDWSKMHYKRKRPSLPSKERVYKKWMRKSYRPTEKAKTEDVEMNTLPSTDFSSNHLPSVDTIAGNDVTSVNGALYCQNGKKLGRQHKSHAPVEPRKSLRLAEKKDVQQKTLNQESVIALEHQRMMLKSAQDEKNRNNFVSDEKSKDEDSKPVLSDFNKAASLRGDVLCDDDAENGSYVQVSGYLVPLEGSLSASAPSVFNSGGYLQQVIDGNRYVQTIVLGSDGIIQPAILDSDGFTDPAMDSMSYSVSIKPTEHHDPAIVTSTVTVVQQAVMSLAENSTDSNNSSHQIEKSGLDYSDNSDTQADSTRQGDLSTTVVLNEIQPDALSGKLSSKFTTDMDDKGANDVLAVERNTANTPDDKDASIQMISLVNKQLNGTQDVCHSETCNNSHLQKSALDKEDDDSSSTAKRMSTYGVAEISNLDMLARASDLVEKSLDKKTFFNVHEPNHCSCVGQFYDSYRLSKCSSTDVCNTDVVDVGAGDSADILSSKFLSSHGVICNNLTQPSCTVISKASAGENLVSGGASDNFCQQSPNEIPLIQASEVATVHKTDCSIGDSYYCNVGSAGVAETVQNNTALRTDVAETKVLPVETENSVKILAANGASTPTTSHFSSPQMHFASHQLASNCCSPTCQHLHRSNVAQVVAPGMFNAGVANSGLGSIAPMLENLTTAAVQKLVMMLLSQFLSTTQNFNHPMLNSVLQPCGFGMQTAARPAPCCGNCNYSQQPAVQMTGSGSPSIHGVQFGCGLASGAVQMGTELQPGPTLQVKSDVQPIGGMLVGDGVSCSPTMSGHGLRNDNHMQGCCSHPMLTDSMLIPLAQLSCLQSAGNNLSGMDTGWLNVPFLPNNSSPIQFSHLQQLQAQNMLAAMGMSSQVPVAGASDLSFGNPLSCQLPMVNLQQCQGMPILDMLQQQQSMHAHDSCPQSIQPTQFVVEDRSRSCLQLNVQPDERISADCVNVIPLSQMIPPLSNLCGEAMIQLANHSPNPTFPSGISVGQSPELKEPQLATSLPDRGTSASESSVGTVEALQAMSSASASDGIRRADT